MSYDSERAPLAIVLHLDEGMVSGEVSETSRDRVAQLLEASGAGSTDFIHLSSASVFDRDGKLVARRRALSVSRSYVRMAHEDERAPHLLRVKHLVSVEDYDKAKEELDTLLGQFDHDAETLYVAGLVARGAERPQDAVEFFRKALGLALDEGFRSLINRHLAEPE